MRDNKNILEKEDIEETYDDWEKESERMLDYMKETSIEQKYMKMYSSFSNFPTKIKKEIITNLFIVIGITILFFMSIFILKYYPPLIFIVYFAVTIFLCWKIFLSFFYLRHAHFITFTGRITDSHVEGTKFSGTKHYVLKLTADDGKELSFPFYGNEVLNFDQYITLFININSQIIPSQYGPYVQQYIEAVPTDEIESRMKMLESMENGSISVNDYVRK